MPTLLETLVKHFQKLKSGNRTSATDLPSLLTSSENLSTDILPGEHFNHDTKLLVKVSTLRVLKSKLINLNIIIFYKI